MFSQAFVFLCRPGRHFFAGCPGYIDFSAKSFAKTAGNVRPVAFFLKDLHKWHNSGYKWRLESTP